VNRPFGWGSQALPAGTAGTMARWNPDGQALLSESCRMIYATDGSRLTFSRGRALKDSTRFLR
jgi:hypothetical protein